MGWEQLVWTRERARQEGVSRERLTGGREFVRVTRDRYLELAWAEEPRARAAAVLSAMPPGSCLSHVTSLELGGLPVPHERAGECHVTVPAGSSVPVGAGVHGHRSRERLRAHPLHGLPATGLPRSWCDLAGLAPSLPDLVATGDALLAGSPTAREQVRQLLDRRPGGRGTALAQRASRLLDARAESPQESRLRVVLTLAGLAPPALQHVVRTTTGAFVARVDLAWPDAKLAVEYDGEHHRTRLQWAADVRRREALERAGWVVVVVLAADLRGPADVLAARVLTRLHMRSAV